MSKSDEAVKKETPAAEVAQEVKVESGASAEITEVEPDWKELLRIERQRSEKAEEERDNYKEGLLSRKRQEKAARVVELEPEVEEDKIANAVKKALEPIASQLAGNKVDQILASIVADPSKREYVKSLYSTRIQRTGTSDDAIRLDLETALTLADASRKAKEVDELKRMNDNRTYIPPTGGSGGSAGDRAANQKAHKWSPEQEASLEERARANGISDVEKYKDLAWKAANDGSAFSVKKKYL